MNKFLIIVSWLLALVWLGPCLATAPRMSMAKLAGDVAPHVVSYEYPPLVTGDTANPGAAVEIITQAFSASGKAISVENFPSKKFALQLLNEDGKVIALLAEARTLSAAEHKSLNEEKILKLTGRYFFYRPGGKKLEHITELKMLKGFSYGSIGEEATVEQSQAGIKIVTDEPKLLLRKLQSKEIDLISAYPPNGVWLIARLFPDEKDHFVMMKLKAWESNFSLWFDGNNKASKDWRTAFDEGFKKIRQNGIYSDILKKYSLEDAALK